MKRPLSKPAAAAQTAVFQKELHRLRPDAKITAPTAKPKKRDNIFSKSRDIREDRGSRQMKMAHNPQSLPHGR